MGFEPSFAIWDFSERDMCAVLDKCPQAFLERNLLSVINYDYTIGHMRMALVQLRCERLLDILKMLQSWMQQIDDRRLDEVERVFSDPLVRKKSRKKSHDAAEDPLDEFGFPRVSIEFFVTNVSSLTIRTDSTIRHVALRRADDYTAEEPSMPYSAIGT